MRSTLPRGVDRNRGTRASGYPIAARRGWTSRTLPGVFGAGRVARRLLEPGHHGGIGRRPPSFPVPYVGKGAAGAALREGRPPLGPLRPRGAAGVDIWRARGVVGRPCPDTPPRGCRGGWWHYDVRCWCVWCRYTVACPRASFVTVIKRAGIKVRRAGIAASAGEQRWLVHSRSGPASSRVHGGRRGGQRASVCGRLRSARWRSSLAGWLCGSEQ